MVERIIDSPRGKQPKQPPKPSDVPQTPLSEATTSPEERPVKPVSFSADNFTHERIDERWVTIARGNVYLAQGDPDSALFMELRSQAAVIFSEKEVHEKDDVRSPYSPKIPRLGAEGQAVTGVYLEGDVIIARGDRSFRGPAAFYDFSTDRAIVVEPVFRTIQKQRNVPIYIRAREARALSAREIWFADAKVSTSEFYTPTYHIGAKRAYLMDNTPYDAKGRRLGEQAWRGKFRDVTFNVRGAPIFYVPFTQGDLEQGNSALRKLEVGKQGKFGWGAESQWHLFRLLGLVKPEGFKGRLDLGGGEEGAYGGVKLEYARKDFSGYHHLYGMLDADRDDDFGTERENIDAPRQRGRVLMRHKQFLPKDWQMQFELSYICDRNFLEQFFPDEFYAGKEQETLLYAKKQKDNWAFTSLLKTRLNRFQSQDESYPDLGLYLLGEPLLGDRLTFFHESHAGFRRFRPENRRPQDRPEWDRVPAHRSRHFVRLDTRNQLDFPFQLASINIVPYVIGRATYWDDDFEDTEPAEGKKCRLYGQVGVRANTHIWAVYNGVESRLWDLHRLKHIITPEVAGWLGCVNGVYPENLFPMDAEIEQHLDRTSGFALNLYQRLQTKRGPADNRRTVDWMRLNLSLGIYNNGLDALESDGRFFGYRPEYSLARNHLNAEYFWYLSDSTTLLADVNFDIDDKRLGRGNIGFAVQHDPRLRYYAGARYIDDLNSAVGTFGVSYKINRKYTIAAFEQYDFAFRDGRNLSTSVTITRKFPRWYSAFTFSYDNSTNDV
ncbi:MAG: LPS-assembly protein LptD, partial [Planctomycetota bacterium]